MIRWLDARTGIPTALRAFFNEEIPASCGWAQVFGSVALFLFLTQAFTGILLAINYAPTPPDAYQSLQYIVSQVTAGRMIRGLHHWGASMMIVVVVLHMTQVFLYGAYRKPREATWMVGVMLLLATLAFGLTGYLLPWDNRAYWGTVVTTRIAGQAPLLGPAVERLLGAETGVGAVTFARFYALHTIVLPLAAFALVAFHVYLVKRHGAAPAPDDTRPTRRFFPAQAFKDTCAIFAAFAILFLLTTAAQVPLDRLADPTDTTYIPRPDWYFLFLFQTLKLFQGAAEQIGSVLLPSAAVALLVAVPFLDRARLHRVTRRTVAIAVVALGGAAWTTLTAAAVLTTPHSEREPVAEAPWERLTPQQLAGLGVIRQSGCATCHNLADGPPKAGPNFAGLGVTVLTPAMLTHFTKDGQLDRARIDAVAAFLHTLTPANAPALAATPAAAIAGAQVFLANGCGNCHTINGAGGAVGPVLNGVAARRTKTWVIQHLRDPKSQSPRTVMPQFQLTDQDRDRLIAYLFSLPAS